MVAEIFPFIYCEVLFHSRSSLLQVILIWERSIHWLHRYSNFHTLAVGWVGGAAVTYTGAAATYGPVAPGLTSH